MKPNWNTLLHYYITSLKKRLTGLKEIIGGRDQENRLIILIVVQKMVQKKQFQTMIMNNHKILIYRIVKLIRLFIIGGTMYY